MISHAEIEHKNFLIAYERIPETRKLQILTSEQLGQRHTEGAKVLMMKHLKI